MFVENTRSKTGLQWEAYMLLQLEVKRGQGSNLIKGACLHYLLVKEETAADTASLCLFTVNKNMCDLMMQTVSLKIE